MERVLPYIFTILDLEFPNSATGTRTRVAWVKTRYPNLLDYSGDVDSSHVQCMHETRACCLETWSLCDCYSLIEFVASEANSSTITFCIAATGRPVNIHQCRLVA